VHAHVRLCLSLFVAGLGWGVPAPAGAAFQTPTTVATTKDAPVTPVVSLDAAETRAIAGRWGIEVESLTLTASGYMLDFRYRVLDARKARPIFERRTKPVLRDEATGVDVAVPVPPKTGALRSSNDPKAGRTYFMFFANPARFIKAGSPVTITIGPVRITGLRVGLDGRSGERP
jgi:hypothetical protein